MEPGKIMDKNHVLTAVMLGLVFLVGVYLARVLVFLHSATKIPSMIIAVCSALPTHHKTTTGTISDMSDRADFSSSPLIRNEMQRLSS